MSDRELNKHFRDVKNIHKNETLILFAPGPSLNEYNESKILHKDVVYMGVNGTILHENIRNKLDYYIWSSDIDIPAHPQPGFRPMYNAIPLLKSKTKCYINCWTNGSIIHPKFNCQTQLHPQEADKLKGNWKKYNQSTSNNLLTMDIEEGLNHFTVIMQALNIALHMGFNRIILVGVDAGGGHSYKDKVKSDKCDWGENGVSNTLLNTWKRAKVWVQKNYPNVEIINFNPRGLKGIFEELQCI